MDRCRIGVRGWRARSGLTIVELLVVIGIIAILVSLALGVAAGVSASGKTRLTESVIKALDGSLHDYMTSRDGLPPAFIQDPRREADGTPLAPDSYFPVADARNMALDDDGAGLELKGNQMINSVALFMESIKKEGSAYQALAELDPRVLETTSTNSGELLLTGSDPLQEEMGPIEAMPLLPTVLDGWGEPIRFVHPAYFGAIYDPYDNPSDPTQGVDMDDLNLTLPSGGSWAIDEIRRNAQTEQSEPANAEELPDSDGGRLTSTSPYFYSAGEDGLVGALRDGNDPDAAILANYNADNVYTVRPVLPTNDEN